jgi:hypothetical protein
MGHSGRFFRVSRREVEGDNPERGKRARSWSVRPPVCFYDRRRRRLVRRARLGCLWRPGKGCRTSTAQSCCKCKSPPEAALREHTGVRTRQLGASEASDKLERVSLRIFLHRRTRGLARRARLGCLARRAGHQQPKSCCKCKSRPEAAWRKRRGTLEERVTLTPIAVIVGCTTVIEGDSWYL